MLNKEQIVEELNKFCEKYGVEKEEIEVFSGAAMVLLGLRLEASDIDMYLDRSTCERLIATGDFQVTVARKGPEFLRFENDIFDIGDSKYQSDKIIDGYLVQSVKSLYELKMRMNREKDQDDIKSLKEVMGL